MVLAFPLLHGLPALIRLRISRVTGILIDGPLRFCPGSPRAVGRLWRPLFSPLPLLRCRQLRLGARSACLCYLSVSQHGVQPACATATQEPSIHAVDSLHKYLGGA